jgi:hypothetical protein
MEALHDSQGGSDFHDLPVRLLHVPSGWVAAWGLEHRKRGPSGGIVIGGLAAADLETSCPSAWRSLSAYREIGMAAVTDEASAMAGSSARAFSDGCGVLNARTSNATVSSPKADWRPPRGEDAAGRQGRCCLSPITAVRKLLCSMRSYQPTKNTPISRRGTPRQARRTISHQEARPCHTLARLRAVDVAPDVESDNGKRLGPGVRAQA